jgi:hypothetical protein
MKTSTAAARSVVLTSICVVATLAFTAGTSVGFQLARATSGSGTAPQKEHEAHQEKPKEVIVTGCLMKRDKPGDFALTTRDAKLYYVESTTVDLSAHVRHTVTVTGTFVPDSETRDDPDKSGEAETINVTKLEMVSKTCR